MGFFPVTPRFSTGEILLSPEILRLGFDCSLFLRRHQHGDWGDFGHEDAEANENAVKNGEGILSRYLMEDREDILVIMTEDDRSYTMVFFLNEPDFA